GIVADNDFEESSLLVLVKLTDDADGVIRDIDDASQHVRHDREKEHGEKRMLVDQGDHANDGIDIFRDRAERPRAVESARQVDGTAVSLAWFTRQATEQDPAQGRWNARVRT